MIKKIINKLLNIFCIRPIKKITDREIYNILTHSKIFYILQKYPLICRLYYKTIFNPIKYNILWPLKYNKKLKNIIGFKYSKTQKHSKMTKYTLQSVRSPSIVLGVPVTDLEIGGIKLVYSVSSKEYPITEIDNKEIVFWKPFKKYWTTDKKSCKKGEWGNARSPFTNVWLQIPSDYTDYEKERDTAIFPYIVVTNPKLIKNLNLQSKKFSIGDQKEKTKNGFKKWIIITLKMIWYSIINRILINQKSK
jgi:hypothetical protein